MPEISEKRLKELESAEKKVGELEDSLKETEEKNKELESTIEEKDETIAEKDKVIEKKNEDIVGVRKKYSEMNQEEKEKLTEQEKQLMQQAEELEEKQKQFEKEQEERLKKEVNARKNRAFKDLVGEDEELREKLEHHYGRIKDSEEATTEEEIRAVANDAYHMLGDDKPDQVAGAVNDRKTGSGESNRDDYSETPEGKDVAKAMGLQSANQSSQESAGETNDNPNQGGNPLDRA